MQCRPWHGTSHESGRHHRRGGALGADRRAHACSQAGLTPLVLEADDRVGGRILTEEVLAGLPVELGAQWIGDTHDRMFALAAELGVETYPAVRRGRDVLRARRLRSVAGERVSRPLRRRAAPSSSGCCAASTSWPPRSRPSTPWPAPRAAEWDAITAGAWYDAQGLSPVARTLLEICTVGILAVPTVEVSFLHLLFTIQTCGVTSELFAESEGGAQTTRFVGGTGEIPNRLAALIADHIVLDVAGAADRARRRQRHRALPRRAGRPAAAGSSSRSPRRSPAGSCTTRRCPAIRDQLTQRLPNGSAMKAFFVYDEPFWRADGFNGQLISDVGPARMSNDTCIPGDDHGVILLFLEGEQARTYGRLPEEERRAALTAELVRHFGSKAAHPEFYVDGEWSDRQWTRGCYNANLGPQVWTTYGAGAHRADRRDPLGVNRYRDLLERLHGGRRRGGRAGGAGGHRPNSLA